MLLVSHLVVVHVIGYLTAVLRTRFAALSTVYARLFLLYLEFGLRGLRVHVLELLGVVWGDVYDMRFLKLVLFMSLVAFDLYDSLLLHILLQRVSQVRLVLINVLPVDSELI